MRGLFRRAGRLLAIALGASVGALHVALLVRRVLEGTLFEPLVITQWLIAIVLGTLGLWLRRRGVSLLRGRPAAAIWIVIALMHGLVALPAGPGFVGIVGAIPVTGALPLGAGLLIGALALAAALLLGTRVQVDGVPNALPWRPMVAPWTHGPSPLAARAPPV